MVESLIAMFFIVSVFCGIFLAGLVYGIYALTFY